MQVAARQGALLYEDNALRLRLVVLVALSLALGAMSVFRFPLNHDAAWLLYLAGQVNHGARMYVDFPEVNPPLIVWLNMPIAYAAEHLSLPVGTLFRVVVLALSCASVFGSAYILRSSMGTVANWSWLSAASFAAVALPGYDFGQREHLALLLVLPYLAEAATRHTAAEHRRILHFSAATCAAMGVALKPHFLLLPLLVEAVIILRTGRRLSAAPLVIASLIGAYGICVLLLTPEYFPMARMFARSYWNYSGKWFSFVFIPEFHIAVLLVVVAWCVRPNPGILLHTLSVAAAAFTIAALVQHKAWTYHWYPVIALAWLLFAQAATASMTYRERWPPHLIVCLVATLLTAITYVNSQRNATKSNPFPEMLGPTIEELGGGPVMIFATPLRATFPLVIEPGIGTSSRFPSMGVIRAAHISQDTELARYVSNALAEDMRNTPPRLLIVETSASFDYWTYLLQDPHLADALRHYQLAKIVGNFRFFNIPAGRRTEDDSIHSHREPAVKREKTPTLGGQ